MIRTDLIGEHRSGGFELLHFVVHISFDGKHCIGKKNVPYGRNCTSLRRGDSFGRLRCGTCSARWMLVGEPSKPITRGGT